MNEEQSKKYLSGGGKIKDLPEGLDGTDLGACEWVELRKMEDSEDGVPTYCSNDMKPSPKRTRDCERILSKICFHCKILFQLVSVRWHLSIRLRLLKVKMFEKFL